MNEHPEDLQPDRAEAATDDSASKPQPASVAIRVSRTVGLLLLIGVCYLLYRQFPSWQENSARQDVAKRQGAPEEWKGIQMKIPRSEVAQMFVDSGVRWPSIQKPGMAPTVWAAHVNLTVNGHAAKEFSIRFSDGQRWDYGQHPQVSDDLVDSKTLIGGFDAQATVTGLIWKIERSDFDLKNDTVPVEVLSALGAPHSEETDITGLGRIYHWEWPTLRVYYTTVDGAMAWQTPDAIGT